ncbi:DNA-binding protein [Stutzerimonas urumqiensis]|uniref:DNA-binding protein n=1 Tax=Stutzerimonas urumqiensis TaxID=638269 RepID=UPI003BAAD95F
MHATYAPEQACQAARKRLERAGKTVKQFAEENGLNPSTVYAVINGQKKCLRGESHRAAVLLGIKQGVILAEPEKYGRRKDDVVA